MIGGVCESDVLMFSSRGGCCLVWFVVNWWCYIVVVWFSLGGLDDGEKMGNDGGKMGMNGNGFGEWVFREDENNWLMDWLID